MKTLCPCVAEARKLNRQAVIFQRFGYYTTSGPLFRRVHGLMRAARYRAQVLSH